MVLNFIMWITKKNPWIRLQDIQSLNSSTLLEQYFVDDNIFILNEIESKIEK